MMRSAPFALVALLALGGCAEGPTDSAMPTTAEPASLAGVYSGVLPCHDCQGIAATLWLRADRRFFLRQQIRDGAEQSVEAPTYGLGRWEWDEHSAAVVLRGAGPERRLVVRDHDHVELVVTSPLEHLLTRDPAARPFADRLTLDGESATSEHGATFRECLTGLELTVADSGEYRELRRQHRRMNALGKVALTSVEGHIVTTGSAAAPTERLVIDRLITIRPGTPCPPR